MGIWDWLINDPFTGKPPDIYGKLHGKFETIKAMPEVAGLLRNSINQRSQPQSPASVGGGLNPITELLRNVPGRLAQSMQPRQPSLQDILAELQRLQDPSRYGVDPAMLERQAMAMASAQYDPITAALRGQASGAQQRAGRNREQLGSMYSGLSQSLMNDIAPIQQQYAGTQQKTADQYQQLQSGIKQQYADSQAEQEAMMQRLNIEAAAPQALERQFSDRDFAVTQAAQQGQNVQSQLEQQGQGAVTYTRQGSELAKTEGTNRQADLMSQLSDYLNQIGSQIAGNEAAKNQSYMANLSGLQQDASKSGIANAQRDFENYLKVIGVMQSMQPKQQGPVSSPIDIAPRVMGSFGLDANGAQQVQNAFMSAISSDPLINAGVDPAQGGINLTKEALANRVVEEGKRRGMSGAQLNALQEVALEYFGRQ